MRLPDTGALAAGQDSSFLRHDRTNSLPRIRARTRHATRESNMNVLAFSLFVVLVLFGRQVIGWHDELGKVQMVLVASFVLGYFAGVRRSG